MNKRNIINRLMRGENIGDILLLRTGQECEIYKADSFLDTNDVIYIPDISLNNIKFAKDDIDEYWTEDEEVQRLKGDMYTGREFVEMCGGNRELAEELFNYVDWQHPGSVLDADEIYWEDDNDEWN